MHSASFKCWIIVAALIVLILFEVLTHAYKRYRYKLCVPIDDEYNKKDDHLMTNRLLEYVIPQETKHLDCGKMINSDIGGLKEYTQNRIIYRDPPWPDDLRTDCRSIFKRNYFQMDRLYEEEERFPLAFVRVVYRDYRQVEAELASTYAPQNTYCYALDSKCSKTFHSRMSSLAACFPNVYLTRISYPMDSSGHNMSNSFMECLKLIKPIPWEYTMLLQNHDVAMKTNQELIRIFTLYNGTNDVSANKAQLKRIRSDVNWSFKWLSLFKNKSRNSRVHNQQPPILQFSKSLAQVALSRAAVDFMLNELNLDGLIQAFEWDVHGVDEQLIGTLNANDAIDLPGGYTLQCLRKGLQANSYMRLSFWFNDTSCQSGIKRHRICVFGMEDLKPNLYESPYLFANKFMQDKDFGALSCWHQLMFNRTHNERGYYRIDRQAYLNMSQVRFNRQRQEEGEAFRSSNFQC